MKTPQNPEEIQSLLDSSLHKVRARDQFFNTQAFVFGILVAGIVVAGATLGGIFYHTKEYAGIDNTTVRIVK